MSKLKVLYFMHTDRQTNHDKQAAFYTGQAVAFRNVALVMPDAPDEDCDAVMGITIPAQYAGKPNVSP